MKDYHLWSTVETKLLEIGIVPTGRTALASRTFCRRNGISFPGKRQCDANERLIKDIEEKFSQVKGHTMAKTTKKKVTASTKNAKATTKAATAKESEAKPEERAYSFRTINIDNIIDMGDNIREVKNIDELMESIKAHGIINPITVANDFGMATNYRVIAGFRRLAAAKQLGLKKIPCHVVDKDAEGFDEIPLSENITRMDMTPYEECMAVKSLSNSKKTPAAIAKHFGRTLRWVLVRKKLADAGDKVLKKVKEGTIELAQAAKIADLPDNVFKRELESCYRTDKYFIDGVLDRFHKDLSRAPFEHEACLQCSKCSACQADLFENEPKAYCLDPNCWARKAKKAAEAKVKKLQEEGRNARLGKFGSCGVSYDDEANDFEIGKYNKELQEQAKEAGIHKRVLVDTATCKTFEYFDKRDLPDYHEESEEEREERIKTNRLKERMDSTRINLMLEKLQEAIFGICSGFKSDADIIVTLLVFAASNNDDFFSEEGKKILGIDGKTDEGWSKSIEEMPNDKTYRDVAAAVRASIKDIVSDIDNLRQFYTVIGGNVDRIAVTDEEVMEEIKRNDEKNGVSEDQDDDQFDYENEEEE